MHFGLICNEYPPAPHGGNGSLYSDLAMGLVRAGHRVTVVGVYTSGVLAMLGVAERTETNLKIVRLRQSPGFLRYRAGALLDRWRLLSWLQQEHRCRAFDVIESPDFAGWLNWGGPKGMVTIIRMGGSNLFFDHELNRRGYAFVHELERKCVLRATVLGAVSHYAARRTLDLCGLSSRPVTVIHNAVDTQLFSPATNIATEPGLIVFINTVGPRKGIGQLLEAMNHVCRSHSTARLVAIGGETRKGTAGKSYTEELLDRVQPEFRNRVIFTGRLSREGGVLDYLRKAHVCCYPSHMETFGIAPVEAMAVGKPTIYSKTGPGPEVIEDGVSGLLCDPRDPRDIAAKILSVLDNPSFAARLGQNARQRVLKLFDKKDWITRNVKFFESCLKH